MEKFVNGSTNVLRKTIRGREKFYLGLGFQRLPVSMRFSSVVKEDIIAGGHGRGKLFTSWQERENEGGKEGWMERERDWNREEDRL